MDIKELFSNAENGTLTFESFSAAATKAGAKFVDLSTGDYVSRSKYDSDITSRDNQITTLNKTITDRDNDLKDLNAKLTTAGTDKAQLDTVTQDLADLRTKYDNDMKSYKQQLASQAYEFAVKEFAATKKFTSNAAKRDFESSLIAKKLKMEDGKILGAEDFVTAYATDNADAFVVEEHDTDDDKKGPKFTLPVGNGSDKEPKDLFNFNFVGVRSHDTK